jgi:carbon storage regulator CsrA
MLILSRKAGQSIVVAKNISISVLGVRRGAVRLGIQAPVEVRVCREELLGGRGRPAAGAGTAGEAGGVFVPDRSSSDVEAADVEAAPPR